MKKQDFKVALFIIGCVLINYGGRTLSDFLGLPLWLDSIGTIAAAYYLGPVVGAIVGVTLNCMYGAVDPGTFIYCITNGAVGVLAGILCRKGMLKEKFKAFSLSMILALAATMISLPINLIFYDGLTYNEWGDAVIHYLEERNINTVVSCFAGEFCVDMVDKLISVIIVFNLVKMYEKRSGRKDGKSGKSEKDGKSEKGVSVSASIALFLMMSLLVPFKVSAATDLNDFSDYTRTTYSSEDGLLGEVTDIAQTRDGMLWIGTYGGLYQYDGNRFVFMSNFDSVKNVNCLYTDEEGRLWIGTNDSGLSICTDNSIVNVIDDTGGLSANSVRSIIKNSEGLYFIGTTGALDIVNLSDGVHVSSVCEDMTYVKNLSADSNGYVCAVTSDGELGLFYDETLLFKQESDEAGEKYTCCYFDENGILYTATADNKIRKCSVKAGKIFVVKTYDCSALNLINSIYLNDDGFLFVCSDSGIGYIDENGKLQLINTAEFDSSIDNMLIDYQGNYWFSSSRLGLLKLCRSSFEELFVKLGFDESVVNCVTKWNNMYLFGTDSGMDICDGNLEYQTGDSIEKLFDGIRIRHLQVDDGGKLWVATSGKGVFVLNKDGSYEQYTCEDGLAADKARAFCALSDGSMAIATDGGVSIFKNGRFTNYGADEGFVTERTLCLFENDGKLYCGTDGGGVVVIENGAVTETVRRSDGLGSDIILRMVMDSKGEGMFIITSNGMNYMSADGSVKRLKTFPYYNDFDLIISPAGKVWVPGSAGIYIVDEDKLIADEITDYELLDARKGLRQDLVSNSWNYTDEDGNLILCADSGALSINMNEYDDVYATYRIMLESILVDGVTLSVDKEEENTISRDAVRIEFIPEVINYSVNDPYVSIWLEGFEDAPTVVAQSELENPVYTNLPSGYYVFHIAILDSMQGKTIEEVSYSFYKEKELYDNWWFNIYIFVVISIIIVYLVWLLVGTQINKSLKIQRQEIENLKLKQDADAAYAAGEAKDRFLALMSHDIRTPINAILGMDEMILRECKDGGIYDYATDIKSAGDTLLSIVNSILDFSKIEQGKMEIVPAEYDTAAFLKNLIKGISMRAEKKKLDMRLDIDENLPAVLYGDDVRIAQVLSNLLTNAVKYTEKGYVLLKARTVRKEDGFAYIYFEVKDSGIGIKKEDMSRLFDSFQRLDEKRNRNVEGTGLGMSIVSNLLYLMDSELKVESEYGAGSTFGFELKQKIVSDAPMGAFDADTASHGTIGERGKEKHIKAPTASVLVVDDSSLNLKVAASLLKINEIMPDTAESGQEALNMIAGKHYDIILLDHMMPELDGVETFRAMKEQKLIGADTKVIVLTANAIVGAKEQYLKLGFDDYLAKPIDAKLLEEKIAAFIPNKVVYDTALDDAENAGAESSSAAAAEVENGDVGTLDDAAVEALLAEICPDIDIPTAMKYSCDSWDFYMEIVKAMLDEYYHGGKAGKLDEFYKNKDYDNYRILVHTIKSTTLSIGATDISADAKKLEMAVKEENISYVTEKHEQFMKDFTSMCERLNKFMEGGSRA